MILSVSRYVAEQEEKKAAEQQALEEAELAAKAERRQEIVAAMQEAITTLPSGDTAATSLPSEENSLSDDLKALLNEAGSGSRKKKYNIKPFILKVLFILCE